MPPKVIVQTTCRAALPVKPSIAQLRSALPSIPLSQIRQGKPQKRQEPVLIKACEEQGLHIGKLFCYPIWAWTLWNKTLWNQISTVLWLNGILWTNPLLLTLPMLTIPPWSWYSTISPPTAATLYTSIAHEIQSYNYKKVYSNAHNPMNKIQITWNSLRGIENGRV